VAVTSKPAVDDPAGTFTEAGTVSAELSAETDTMTPPAEAGLERVRVQVEEAPASRFVDLHVNEETSTAASRSTVAVWEAPFSVAEMVADWGEVGLPAVALKVAEAAAAATVTEAGTVSKALLSDSATIVPPVGAAWFRVTVHVVEARGRRVAGLQVRSVRPGGTTVVIVPPVAIMGIAVPDGVAPNAPVMPIEVVVVPGEIVAFTIATTPVLMLFALTPLVLRPLRKQL
jgi:hypothetical protein